MRLFGNVLSFEHFPCLCNSTLTGTIVFFSLNCCFLTEIVYKEKYLQYISFIFMSNRNQENLF